MKWKTELTQYLISNYPLKSNGVIDDMQKIFGVSITPLQLYSKASNLKLKVLKERKRESYAISHRRYKYPDHTMFTEIKDNRVAYIMGLFWADGYLNDMTLSLEMAKEDLDTIKYIFTSLGEWCISDRNRKDRKEQLSIKCHDYTIRSIFSEYGYFYKSENSPSFIKADMDSDICKCFVLGWFDGDGCIYSTKTQTQLYFCGHYNQNWEFTESILKLIEIKYSLKLKTQKSGKYSIIYIGGKSNIKKFLNWMYSTEIKGLKRKYDKYLNID